MALTSYVFSENCSTREFMDFLYHWNISNNISSKDDFLKPDVEFFNLGTVIGVGVVILFVTDVLLSFEYIKRDVSSLKTPLLKQFHTKNVSRILVLTLLILMLPLVALFLVLALVYKVLCLVVIRRKDEHFVEFLDSFDVFWSLEDDASKSIINVLGVMESDSPLIIANNIKEKLEHLYTSDETKKIFYRRNEEFGFYYWRKYGVVDMNQYVEIIEIPEKDELEVADLENLMTDLQKEALPYGDEGLFKILITKQRVGKNCKERGEYGIIFRIHHSVGDGVALIELLCQAFADKDDCCPVNMFSFPDPTSNHDSPQNLIDMMRKLCEIPICFIDGIIRKPDDSILHGPELLGTKVFKWTQSDENLLTIVKEIKDSVDNLNFTDVLLSCLSNGLQNFFSRKLASIPEDVAVVLPIRFPKGLEAKNDMKLKNDFSVTILDLPVEEKDFALIKNRCNLLRKSVDPLTNFYFLKVVCSVLPKAVLKPLMNSSQATMVFSNLPGPEVLSICGGNVLKELVFFVPHKGNTGLGVTALCYGGMLRFAAMSDTALVSGPEDLALILDGMVDEIYRLHRLHVN